MRPCANDGNIAAERYDEFEWRALAIQSVVVREALTQAPCFDADYGVALRVERVGRSAEDVDAERDFAQRRRFATARFCNDMPEESL